MSNLILNCDNLFPLLLVDTSQEICKLAIIEYISEETSFNLSEIEKSGDKFSDFKLSTNSFTPKAGLAECLDIEVSDLLKNTSTNIKSLKYILTSFGPGSFTGLRTGIAFSKGLSLGLKIPIVLSSNLLAGVLSNFFKIANEQNLTSISSNANKEEDFFLQLNLEHLKNVISNNLGKFVDLKLVTSEISVVPNEKSKEVNQISLENIREVDLVSGYLKAFLLAQAIEGLNLRIEKIFSDQLAIYSAQDQIVEPLYVKGVSALTLKERGVVLG